MICRLLHNPHEGILEFFRNALINFRKEGAKIRIIKSLEDIECLRKAKALPESYLAQLEKVFLGIIEAYGGEWDPSSHGYMVVLEIGDNIRDLSIVGLNPEDEGILGTYPEFIDVINLQEISIYKILVIYSNDYAMTFFSVVNQFDEIVESWIKSHITE